MTRIYSSSLKLRRKTDWFSTHPNATSRRPVSNSSANIYRTTVRMYRAGTPIRRFRRRNILHIPVRKIIHHNHRPQSIRDDRAEVTCLSPTKITEDASPTVRLEFHARIPSRQEAPTGRWIFTSTEPLQL